jgi:hypothetical protein
MSGALKAESPGTALIEFRCVRREHIQRSTRMTLTIYKARWAFCRHEGPVTDHEWVPTGGVTLREMLRLKPREGRAAAR